MGSFRCLMYLVCGASWGVRPNPPWQVWKIQIRQNNRRHRRQVAVASSPCSILVRMTWRWIVRPGATVATCAALRNFSAGLTGMGPSELLQALKRLQRVWSAGRHVAKGSNSFYGRAASDSVAATTPPNEPAHEIHEIIAHPPSLRRPTSRCLGLSGLGNRARSGRAGGNMRPAMPGPSSHHRTAFRSRCAYHRMCRRPGSLGVLGRAPAIALFRTDRWGSGLIWRRAQGPGTYPMGVCGLPAGGEGGSGTVAGKSGAFGGLLRCLAGVCGGFRGLTRACGGRAVDLRGACRKYRALSGPYPGLTVSGKCRKMRCGWLRALQSRALSGPYLIPQEPLQEPHKKPLNYHKKLARRQIIRKGHSTSNRGACKTT